MSTWLVVAIIGLLGEAYFFFMQRSALEVCRARQLPPTARFDLLPGYYRAGRVPTLIKWAAVALLALDGKWLVAGTIVVAGWIVTAVLPVPHSAFFNVFYGALDDPSNNAADEQRDILRAALESVDREYGATGRFGNDG